MLKRFMNWLLHRLQKVLGGLGKQRGRSQLSNSSQPPLVASDLAQRAADAIAAQNVEAAKNDAIAAPFPANSEPSLPTTELDPDRTPNRTLDADEAALPIEEPAAPSFPKVVSVLLSTSSPQNSDQSSDPSSEQSLAENQSRSEDPLPLSENEPPPNDHLLNIHDLLPAVEPDPLFQDLSAESPPPELPASLTAAVPFEPDLIEADLIEPSDESVDLEAAIEPILPFPESPTEQVEQAVLFSFDIIESPPSQIEEADLAPSAQPVESALQISLDIEAAVADTTPLVESSPESISKPSTSELSTLGKVAELPYPWGLPVSHGPDQAEPPQTENDQIKQDRLSDPASVKNGVVKLLFTLKEGNFHGYISPDDGSKDILFHEKYMNAEIFERLDRGTRVVASIKYMEGKVYATQVNLLP